MKTLLSIIASLVFFTATPAFAASPGYEWPDWIGTTPWVSATQYYNPYAGMAWSPFEYRPVGYSMTDSMVRRTKRIQNQFQFMARDRGSFTIPPAAFGGGYALSLPTSHQWPNWIGRPWWMR